MVEHNTVNIMVRCSIHLKGYIYIIFYMCVSLIGRALCYGHIDTGSSLVHTVSLLNLFYSPYFIQVHIIYKFSG